MNKLEIELIQHTPIIQFQGEQTGALLRGTEIKPKLDKFLIKHAFKSFDEYKEYLIGYKEGMKEEDFKERRAFNYKIRIKTNGTTFDKVPENTRFYLNNMGSAAETDTNMFVESEEIKVEFFSFNNKLINTIKENFNDFLLINNFGFRQNKTFGSFTAYEDKRSNDEIINKIKQLKANQKICYVKFKKDTEYSELLKCAHTIYQCMKSGISYPREEKENSYLFKYMEENFLDEKQFILNNFFHIGNAQNSNKYRYERAVLGVCDFIDYKTLPNKRRGGIIHYDSNEVERYKSPILFKVIDNMLIIIPEEDNDAIYDKVFYFKKEGWKKGKKIKTPSKEEFNLHNFLNYFFENIIDNMNEFKKNHKLDFIEKIEVK